MSLLLEILQLLEDDQSKTDADHDAIKKSVTADVQKSIERKERDEEIDCVLYGVETDDGHIIKIWVMADQAAAFEEELAQSLGQDDDIEDVLRDIDSKLKNCIVDVEWPDIEDDEPRPGSESMSDIVDYDDDEPDFKAKQVKTYDKESTQ
jgi:hypothetical protein